MEEERETFYFTVNVGSSTNIWTKLRKNSIFEQKLKILIEIVAILEKEKLLGLVRNNYGLYPRNIASSKQNLQILTLIQRFSKKNKALNLACLNRNSFWHGLFL